MIPALTPPTDNLYKFISLFGLTIFLFAIYNLGQDYGAATSDKMSIQDIKMNIQKELVYNSQSNLNMDVDSSQIHLRPSFLRKLGEDLDNISELIENSQLKLDKKIELNTEVEKIRINLDFLSTKIRTSYFFVSIGIGLMIFGFFRWWKREQYLRDKILNYEFEDKQESRKRNT